MEYLKTWVKVLEDGVQVTTNNMVEKLYDQLKLVHNDMEALNKEVTQLMVEALENQLYGLTEKAKTIGKVGRLNKSCPWWLGSAANPSCGDEPLSSPLNSMFLWIEINSWIYLPSAIFIGKEG